MTRFRNRPFAYQLTLLAGVVLLFGAMTTALAQEEGRPGGVLRVSVNSAPNHLNPLKHVNSAEYMLGELLYSGLTRVGPDMRAEPDLAVAWSADKDLREWTFELRQGATFHNGDEVTAEDVVATFEKILDPDYGSPGRKNVGPIETVEALDRYRVKFTTSGTYADLPVMLAYTDAKIVPKKILEGDISVLESQEFGSGPFVLKSFEPGQRARVERYDGYFLEGRPYLDAVEQIVYPDSTAEVAAFLNNQIDLIMELPIPSINRVSRAQGAEVLQTPSGRYVNLVMRNTEEPFDDVRVRKALQLAIDREALVDLLLEGYGQPAGDTPISPAYRYQRELPAIEKDVEEARRLLAEAGYPNGVSVTLYAANSPDIRTELGVALREMARPAGFNINVQTIPYDTYLSQVWKQAPFYVGYYNMQPTEDGIFQLTFTSDSAWNESQWNNEEFDSLIAEARATVDDAERQELYGRAQELMREEAPVIIPVFLDLVAAKKDYVMNYEVHPRGAVFAFDQVWLGEGAPATR
jgi:peptide/nickel transport system substrate-binding protein